MAPQINLFSYERSSKKLGKPFLWTTFEPEHQNFLLFIVAFIDAGKEVQKELWTYLCNCIVYMYFRGNLTLSKSFVMNEDYIASL